jgi:hypothetical protein
MHAESCKVGRQAHYRVYQSDGAVPFSLGCRSIHIHGVGKVKECETAGDSVQLVKIEVVGESVCVLIEKACPIGLTAWRIMPACRRQALLDQLPRFRRCPRSRRCGFRDMGLGLNKDRATLSGDLEPRTSRGGPEICREWLVGRPRPAMTGFRAAMSLTGVSVTPPRKHFLETT